MGNPMAGDHFQYEDAPVSQTLKDNISLLKQLYFLHADDLNIQSLDFNCALAYLKELIDPAIINENVLPAIARQAEGVRDTQKPLMLEGIRYADSMRDISLSILNGDIAFFVEGQSRCQLIPSSKVSKRSLNEPSGEPTLRGSKVGFVEDISTNIALIRQRLKTPRLKLRKIEIGTLTRTSVAFLYIESVADASLVETGWMRLQSLNAIALQAEQQLFEAIQKHDHKYSLFPLLDVTERPDRIVGNLLKGHIAILVDGTPFAIIGPVQLLTLIQSPEDYHFSPYLGSFIRLLRLLAIFISLLLPSLYIALTSFHQEMLPTKLALSIQQGRVSVPFPSIMEAVFMEGAFEILREAGLRLPKMLSSTTSIVGGLIIGEAVVKAGIISPQMVIVVAITALSSFIIPSYNLSVALRLFRFMFIILTGFFGAFGLMWGIMMLSMHLVGLRSLGEPYLDPIAPIRKNGFYDTIIRAPFSWLLSLAKKNS
ncbi:spore germination protein KA/spore germination protein [Paenibacillus taihuensis]|uniref:Spore germination protein KA/spore germination protein n=1 Tax=Paenibacillus taihuensis TaxID=1156355 RepID=A0A3D9RI32_9BACL|nr:spore germination protein [Paenibacillus taihuensis]REE77686.1 spore germination protein KA/spore germination protein [Paenibacillus taihuensis]